MTAYDSRYRATASRITLDAGEPLVVSGAAESSYDCESAYNLDGTGSTPMNRPGRPPDGARRTPTRPPARPPRCSPAPPDLHIAAYNVLGRPQQFTLLNSPIAYAGFRMTGGDLVVAMPLCSGETVESAKIAVPSKDEEKGGFETLWSARGPRTAEARGGIFQGSAQRRGTKDLSGALPDEFYVDTRQVRKDRTVNGSGYVDLAELESVDLADGEFVTHEGKVMTRAEINAQLPCNKKDKQK
ncbi:hypothetical protein SCALM49S_06544 [Streptomyces californicus]